MKIKLKNIILVFKDQLPLKRMFRNFVITQNAWGLLSKRSHLTKEGNDKICYSKKSAEKAAKRMEEKRKIHFSVYKCLFCAGYHIGAHRYKEEIKNLIT